MIKQLLPIGKDYKPSLIEVPLEPSEKIPGLDDFSAFIIRILGERAEVYSQRLTQEDEESIIKWDKKLYPCSKFFAVITPDGEIIGTSRVARYYAEFGLPEVEEWSLNIPYLIDEFGTSKTVWGFGRSSMADRRIEELYGNKGYSGLLFHYLLFAEVEYALSIDPESLWVGEAERSFSTLVRRKLRGTKEITPEKNVLGTPTVALAGAVRNYTGYRIEKWVGPIRSKLISNVGRLKGERFSRHWSFISDEEQKKLDELSVMFCGAGLNSFPAELALRSGVHNIAVADGDIVEVHNLPRQNYTESDLGKNKAECLAARLLDISRLACISMVTEYLSGDSLRELVPRFKIIVNTIDFDSPVFAVCQDIARQLGKTLFFPINFSTIGGTVAVFEPGSPTFEQVLGGGDHNVMKGKIINHWIQQIEGKGVDTSVIVNNYVNNIDRPDYDPQTGHGAFSAAALISELLLMIVRGDEVKTFPYVHLHTRL